MYFKLIRLQYCEFSKRMSAMGLKLNLLSLYMPRYTVHCINELKVRESALILINASAVTKQRTAKDYNPIRLVRLPRLKSKQKQTKQNTEPSTPGKQKAEENTIVGDNISYLRAKKP
jgi:hypothetical protein